jgi:hypothetical protein
MCWIIGRKHVRNTVTPATILLIPLVLATCGSPVPVSSDLAAVGRAEPALAGLQQTSTETLSTRLVALDRAVSRWQAASTLRIAHEAAEEARNLIVGASGPFYGDANGDGQIAGASVVGVLPAPKGGASLASPSDNACVVADILGGSWREPAKRWSQFQSALSHWNISRNTFPSLPSHAQRVVGWASLTLKSDSPVEAREYATHARLHVDIAIRALNSCDR